MLVHRRSCPSRRSFSPGVKGKMSLDTITNSELRARLIERGFPAGPVTASTRAVYLRKLKSLIETPMQRQTIRAVETVVSQSDDDLQLLFFDLETSGLELDCEVLQIAVKIGSVVFNEYITPTRQIPWNTTLVNNLSSIGGELYFHDKIVSSRPRRVVLEDLLGYLRKFGKPCVLVAHNCPFDSARLIRALREESMENPFAAVVAGFTDTLSMFKKKYPERRARGSCTLTTLYAETFSMPTDGAHDALEDTQMLEKLALHHFTDVQLLRNRTSFDAAMNAR